MAFKWRGECVEVTNAKRCRTTPRLLGRDDSWGLSAARDWSDTQYTYSNDEIDTDLYGVSSILYTGCVTVPPVILDHLNTLEQFGKLQNEL